jgi:hypothetical protein
MSNKDLKIELVNELSFLLGLQEKVWRYHPNNPNAISVVDEYAKLQADIETIEEQLKSMD